MPNIQVIKSVTVHKDAASVFEVVSNFHHWKHWSPWLIQDPEAKVSVAEDGKSYSWNGKRVGTGEMQVIDEELNKSVSYDLTFLTPHKSEAKVKFDLLEHADGVQVSWHMNTKLPWFMFWMKKMMTAFIGVDYERGLKMLKDYVEQGSVPSKLSFKGVSTFEGFDYLGIYKEATMGQMQRIMKDDFAQIESLASSNPDIIAGKPFAIYHKWDVVNEKVEFTTGIPVKSEPKHLPSSFKKGNIPATKVYQITHVGDYIHLGNAWSSIMAMERANEFKKNRGVHPFEIYDNDPREVERKALSTTIHFAVR